MKPKPIFDTNIFADVQRGLISQKDWSRLLRHRPNRGWPLSNVTALELLAGVDAAKPGDFLHVRDRIKMAYHLSDGRALEDPRYLLCKDVLRIPFPHARPEAKTISLYMDLIRRAGSLDQLLTTGVAYKGRRRGFHSTSILTELLAGPKKGWTAAVEQMADDTYPTWREEEKRTGKRLPPEKRRELKQRSYWQRQRTSYVTSLLDWLQTTAGPATITDVLQRFDAVIEFTIFVSREFLLNSYSLEGHDSDVFDQFQLQYLAMNQFVIVSSDSDLTVRTGPSSQAARIMSFDQFLGSL